MVNASTYIQNRSVESIAPILPLTSHPPYWSTIVTVNQLLFVCEKFLREPYCREYFSPWTSICHLVLTFKTHVDKAWSQKLVAKTTLSLVNHEIKLLLIIAGLQYIPCPDSTRVIFPDHCYVSSCTKLTRLAMILMNIKLL